MKRATLEKTWSRDKGKEPSDRRLEKTHVRFWDKSMVIGHRFFVSKSQMAPRRYFCLQAKGASAVLVIASLDTRLDES